MAQNMTAVALSIPDLQTDQGVDWFLVYSFSSPLYETPSPTVAVILPRNKLCISFYTFYKIIKVCEKQLFPKMHQSLPANIILILP